MIQESLAALTNLLARAVNSVRYNIGLLGLSALLALSLWLFVTNEEDPDRTDEFPFALPVEAVNVPENVAVFGTLEPVTIRLTAPEDTFSDLEASDFRAVADLANSEAGDVVAPVSVEYTGGRRSVDIEEITPNRVSVNVQPVVERSLPVRIDLVGQPEQGFSAAVATTDPENVSVSGPEQAVDLVDVIVGEVDVEQISPGIETFQIDLQLLPVSERGFAVEGVVLETTTADVTVVITRETLDLAVPIVVDVTGAPAVGFRVTALEVDPASVVLSGALDVLEEIDNVETEPLDVEGFSASAEREVNLIAPDGVSLDVDEVTVTVTLEAVEGEATFGLAPTFANIQTGLAATTTSPIILIEVSGPLAELQELTSAQFQAVVDVTGLGPGTYTLPVTIEAPDGIEVTEAPTEITVTIILASA